MALPTTRLHLQIVSADRALVDELVDEVILPGVGGYFGVLPGHAPLIALLGVGQVSYRQGGATSVLALAFGFAEVQPDGVAVLAEIAERAEEIDMARAEAAKRRAEERLAAPPGGELDYERARVALLKALVRLQVAGRARIRS